MHIVTLPYSNKTFSIPTFTFKDVFNLARLEYNNNDVGYISYICNTLNITKLNIVDKLFVVLKVREFFIDDNIALSLDGKVKNLLISSVVDKFKDIPNIEQYIKYTDSLSTVIGVDVPTAIITPEAISDIYLQVIKYIEFSSKRYNISTDEDLTGISNFLGASLMTDIINFIKVSNCVLYIYEDKNTSINVNFLSSDPWLFIKAILSDYDYIGCREILFRLSKRIGSETILDSTPKDIKFFIEEYQAENKSSNSGNSMLNI
jgi:hypothetical protein